MKNFLKISLSLFVFFSLSFNFELFAREQKFQFRSERLNSMALVFQKFSPVLYEEGEVEVSCSGAIGANFVLQKFLLEVFQKNYAFKPNIRYSIDFVIRDTVEFLALGLEESKVEQLISELTVLSMQRPELSFGEVFKKENRGGVDVIWNVSALGFWDSVTNEFLVFSEDIWQDDCD